MVFQCNNSTITDKEGNTEGVTLFVPTYCLNNTWVFGLLDPRFRYLGNQREGATANVRIRQREDFNLQAYSPRSFPAGNIEDYRGYKVLTATPTCARGCLCKYVINGEGYHAYGNPDPLPWAAHGDPNRWAYTSCGSCNSTFVNLFLHWTVEKYGEGPPPCTPYSRDDRLTYRYNATDYDILPICNVPVSPSNQTLMTQLGLDLPHWFERKYIIAVPEDNPNVIQNPFECFDEALPPDTEFIQYVCGPYGNPNETSRRYKACGPGGASRLLPNGLRADPAD